MYQHDLLMQEEKVGMILSMRNAVGLTDVDQWFGNRILVYVWK